MIADHTDPEVADLMREATMLASVEGYDGERMADLQGIVQRACDRLVAQSILHPASHVTYVMGPDGGVVTIMDASPVTGPRPYLQITFNCRGTAVCETF